MANRVQTSSAVSPVLQWTVVLAAVLAGTVAVAQGDVIQYVSATRTVSTFHQYPAPQPNLVQAGTSGFAEFDQHLLVYPENRFNGILLNQARLRADQTSRLLSDRIEASCFAETALTQDGLFALNSLSTSSLLSVVFSISIPTFYTLYSGPIDYVRPRSTGGASVSLSIDSTNQSIEYLEAQTAPRNGVLAPGTYRFAVSAFADARLNGSNTFSIGPSIAVATLVLPEPACICVVLMWGLLRTRRVRGPEL